VASLFIVQSRTKSSCCSLLFAPLDHWFLLSWSPGYQLKNFPPRFFFLRTSLSRWIRVSLSCSLHLSFLLLWNFYSFPSLEGGNSTSLRRTVYVVTFHLFETYFSWAADEHSHFFIFFPSPLSLKMFFSPDEDSEPQPPSPQNLFMGFSLPPILSPLLGVSTSAGISFRPFVSAPRSYLRMWTPASGKRSPRPILHENPPVSSRCIRRADRSALPFFFPLRLGHPRTGFSHSLFSSILQHFEPFRSSISFLLLMSAVG